MPNRVPAEPDNPCHMGILPRPSCAATKCEKFNGKAEKLDICPEVYQGSSMNSMAAPCRYRVTMRCGNPGRTLFLFVSLAPVSDHCGGIFLFLRPIARCHPPQQ